MTAHLTRTPHILPPGNYISEWLENNPKTTKKILAKQLGMPSSDLDAVIGGDEPITSELAENLEYTTGLTADFWLVQQEKYDEQNADISAQMFS